MQITPSYATLQALGTGPSPPEPVRQAATTLAAEAVAPARETFEARQQPIADARPAADAGASGGTSDDGRPGARVDLVA